MPSPVSERRAIFPQKKRSPELAVLAWHHLDNKKRSPKIWKKVCDAEVEAVAHV